MKSLKLIIVVISISLLSAFSLNATEKKPSKINKELRTKIVSILGSKIPLELKKESKASIYFVMNKKNELVILSVDSLNDEVASYIKSKLNYKKIDVQGVKKGETYTLSLKIEVKK